MFRRSVAGVAMLAAIVTGCSSVRPDVDCRINKRCDAVLAAAQSVTPIDQARVVVIWGRGFGFHAEVHVCYGDGRNVLVDVMGDDLKAAVRDTSWESPPCR